MNIGRRQTGRVRAANVIDVAGGRAEIGAAIWKAVSPEFRQSLKGIRNPYMADQPATAIILDRLKSVPLDQQLLIKRFNDFPTTI